ncbi:MAG TPA: isoprenylcysteine carboxylmethyltransferase family protein [Anaeromyxobacteraceae bacterium]|nr:isoprenylcysteine carboxylmethyltransferase family protein [Anaeromyxobacteraceae bacterium]
MFGAAGTLRWPSGWAFLGVMTGGSLLHRAWVARRNPEILKRRKSIGAGTKTWDKVWLAVFWPLMLLVPVVAGLHVVRAQGKPLPYWAWPVGAALFATGFGLSAWAMAANPFFEGTVRIQPGQEVVESGPYRYVRHPGYVGLILLALAMPPLLFSGWAFVPAAVAGAWVVLRTALEDAMLRRELTGYEQYAARVRHRLVPGLW